MTIEVIKQQIDKFLASDTSEVMVIKGAWGVGKTYTWKKFLQTANAESRIALDRYSYISLFGINSLDQFKYSIFENVVNKKLIGTEANIETFKENAASLSNALGRKSLSFFKGIPIIKNFVSAIDSLSFLSINRTLICIDDLERKGTNLSIKDVLGLISQLKEQKNCKVALLLNDNEEGLDDYKKYREKVVDIELHFAPTASECALIAFDSKGYAYETLIELTNKLDIKNIRILKKIERLINIAQPYLANYEKEVVNQFIHSITLFSWCYYCGGKNIPTIDFVTNLGYSSFGIGGNKQASEEHKNWKTILDNAGYTFTDELDLVIADAVKTGYFNKDNVAKEAKKKNTQILAGKSQESFTKAWSLYHNSFADNQDEVVNAIYESFKRNVKNIAPNNLNGTVMLFRDLGYPEKASEILDFYIDNRKNENELFNLQENNFFGDIKDEEVVTKFNKAYSTAVTNESAKQVLARISGQNGWNQKDEVILANTSANEYYELFKLEKSENITHYVNTCLKFGQYQDASEQQLQISDRAKEALIRIARESVINRRRVLKYGVDIKISQET